MDYAQHWLVRITHSTYSAVKIALLNVDSTPLEINSTKSIAT